MVDTHCNCNSKIYEIPSKEIFRNRRAFHDLWRKNDVQTASWLQQAQSSIRRCEFPTNVMEFLLFDRFVCGLNANELKSIQSVNESWTLTQLFEYFVDKSIEANLKIDEHVNQNEDISLDVVKSEPVCLSLG